jgi:hypothetical protein
MIASGELFDLMNVPLRAFFEVVNRSRVNAMSPAIRCQAKVLFIPRSHPLTSLTFSTPNSHSFLTELVRPSSVRLTPRNCLHVSDVRTRWPLSLHAWRRRTSTASSSSTVQAYPSACSAWVTSLVPTSRSPRAISAHFSFLDPLWARGCDRCQRKTSNASVAACRVPISDIFYGFVRPNPFCHHRHTKL